MIHALSNQVARYFGSLQLPAFMLIALLQRTPVLRLFAGTESVWVSSSIGQVLKASAVVASMLGAVDTLAGATAFVTNPESPAEATVGAPFAAVFSLTGNVTVGSYSIANLPPGLSVPGAVAGTLNAATGSITGTPTQEGDFLVSITAFDDPNRGGESRNTTYEISVVAGSANVAPSITTQPASQTVTAGNSVTFTAAASGTPTPDFQWQKSGVNINGATNNTYTIASVTTGDAGNYTAVATNSVSSAASNPATLTVNAAPTAPMIQTQPADQIVTMGGPVSFTVTASGSPAPTYQWRKGGVTIAGATGATYTIASAASGDAGSYTVVATNSAGSATSVAITLTVNAAATAPVITTQPTSQTVIAGGVATFTVIASGNPFPVFQWQKAGVNIFGATSASYIVSNAVANDEAAYTVVATNSVGAVTSNAAFLSVIVAPSDAIITIVVQ